MTQLAAALLRARALIAGAIGLVLVANVLVVATDDGDGDDRRTASRLEFEAGTSGRGQSDDPTAGTTPDGQPAPEVAPGPDLGAGTGPSPSGSGSTGGTSTAPGVTGGSTGGGTVKLGVMLFDIGGASQVGFTFPGVDPNAQREAWQAYIDDLNGRGGAGGRQIEPMYVTYDATSQDSMRAACLRQTNDNKVFAVVDLGGMNGPPVLCVTKEQKTPFLSFSNYGMPDAWYQQSDGRLFTLTQRGTRILRNFVTELDGQGALRGKRIGILADDDPIYRATIDAGIVAELKGRGYEVASRYDLSPDTATGATQIPIAVNEMRNDNVDLVMLATNSLFATQFVQQADSQGFRPKYVTSDWWGGYSDTYAQNMPNAYDGTVAVTTTRTGEFRTSAGEPAADADCRETWERRTKKKLDRATIAYNSTLRACALARLFASGVAGAGADLTRERFSAGMHGLGEVALPTFGGGSFRPGKPDAADQVRMTQWRVDCKCYVPITPFRPGRY